MSVIYSIAVLLQGPAVVPAPPPSDRIFKTTAPRKWSCFMVDAVGNRFDVGGLSPEFKAGQDRQKGGQILLASSETAVQGSRQIKIFNEGSFAINYHVSIGDLPGYSEPTLNVQLYDHGGGQAFITSYKVGTVERNFYAAGVCNGKLK